MSLLHSQPDITGQKQVMGSFKRLLSVSSRKEHGNQLLLVILQESASILERREPVGGGLTADQADYLVKSEAFTTEELAEAGAQVASGELAELQLKTQLHSMAHALDAAEVAQALGIDASTVRHRQAKGLLYSFRAGGKRLYPSWQFLDHADGNPAAVLAGLPRVVAAIPSDMHQATVAGMMTTPKDDLKINGKTVTPVQWLEHGGKPELVAELFEGFLQS